MSISIRTLTLCVLSVLVVASCGGMVLTSRWKDREVVIDGQTPEWYGAVTYLKDDKVSVGLMNDDEFLYVSFTASDRETQMQVLARGVTLWFDPKGGNDSAFGIRFPLGLLDSGAGAPNMDRENRPEPHELVTAYQDPGVEMEILHQDDEPIRLKVIEAPRIDVAISDVQGTLVYELKVPLRGIPHGVGAEAGSTIGVRFMTPEIDREKLQMMAEGGRPPGGGEGGRGDMGRRGAGRGGTGGGMAGPPSDMPAPIDVSARVILASPESAQTPIVGSGGD